MSKDQTILKFDQIIPTSLGFVIGIRLFPKASQNMMNLATETGQHLTVEQLHDKLGHANEETLRKTAKHYQWNITGKLKTIASAISLNVK